MDVLKMKVVLMTDDLEFLNTGRNDSLLWTNDHEEVAHCRFQFVSVEHLSAQLQSSDGNVPDDLGEVEKQTM